MTKMSTIRKDLGGFFNFRNLTELGPQKLTIKSYSVEEFDGKNGKQEQGILDFVETKYRLGINQTRAAQLADVVGDGDVEGTVIEVYAGIERAGNRDQTMALIRKPE